MGEDMKQQKGGSSNELLHTNGWIFLIGPFLSRWRAKPLSGSHHLVLSRPPSTAIYYDEGSVRRSLVVVLDGGCTLLYHNSRSNHNN